MRAAHLRRRMATESIASHVVTAGDGLPVDSNGRPEDPLAPARGIFLGVALGATLWVAAALLIRVLF